MTARLANPRGFCAGVDRAIEVVERALTLHGAPLYVLHEIVHNRRVLDSLRARGVRFVERLDEIPPGAVTIFSAHGVSERVEAEARERGLRVIDATCPLVTKVHHAVRRAAREGRELILVGHAGHPEVEGTLGRHPGRAQVVSSVEEVEALRVEDPERLAYATQTTLSLDDAREVIEALRRRFPEIEGPGLSDVCYATQNRQNAVRELAPAVDALVVVGSSNSSNSNRLRELGERNGLRAYLVDSVDALRAEWFEGVGAVGLTAGASTPEALVQEVVEGLRALGVVEVEEQPGERETTAFRLPPELAGAAY